MPAFTKSDKPVTAGDFIRLNSVTSMSTSRNSVATPTRSWIGWSASFACAKEVPEIGWGNFEVLDTKSQDVIALRYDWRNNAVVVVHNLRGEPVDAHLDVNPKSPDDRHAEDVDRLVNLLSNDHSHGEKGRHTVKLEPYGYRWYRVGGLDYLLRRSP